MLRPYLVDPTMAPEIALLPREGEVVVLPTEGDTVEGPAALTLAPSGRHAGLLVPLGRGWASSGAAVTVDEEDLTSDVLEAPLEIALESALAYSRAPRCARIAGRVARAVTDGLRSRLGLPRRPTPPPAVVSPADAWELVAALGEYPLDFAFFRLDDAERAHCAARVSAACVALGFDRLAGMQFGRVGAVAGVALGRAESRGAPQHVELLWFVEPLHDLEAHNASRPPALRAGLVRDRDLSVAVYPDVPEVVALFTT